MVQGTLSPIQYRISQLLHRNLSSKQMPVTFSDHSKVLTIHKESDECIWLRFMIQHI